MTNLIKHKRVEFSELFYDLVFVYAISKTTALIHHLHHGVLSLDAIFGFLMSLLVLVNSWMIQTVYTNRYGKNSLFNMVVMFVNMAMLLLIANMITNDWQSYFHTFCWTVGTLTLTLFFQYLVEYFRKSTTSANRKSIKGFLWMTGLRTVLVYLAAILANGYFNKSYLKYDKLYYGLQAAFFFIGLVLSLLFSANPNIVITIATLMTLAMEIHFTHFYMTQTKKFSTPDWDLY